MCWVSQTKCLIGICWICQLSSMNTREIIRRAGGPLKVAKAVGRHHATVIGWRRVPAEHVRTVSRMCGIPSHIIRPDVFGAGAADERGAA
ncbi:helix-turn-helix domain-containing protein [Novacetimonas hansenii]